MITPDQALTSIPVGLRVPLLKEFNSIVNHFLERNWGHTELSGGRFCEVIYTIIDGYSLRNYNSQPKKPRNFVDACRRLENNSNAPRSFQILIPRLLPALYEIRNNRGVGHVGGDVNPNYMDSSAVVSMASWIMAEMIRVFHSVSTPDAQQIVDNLVERRLPLVWKSGDTKRVLDTSLTLKEQILVLIASSPIKVDIEQLLSWLDYDNRPYFKKLLRQMHSDRLIELSKETNEVEILPPGSDFVSMLFAKNS